MAAPASYPGIVERVVQLGNRYAPHQVAQCACPGCRAELPIPIKGMRKPPCVIHRVLRHKGWTVQSPRHGEFFCPDHGATQ